MKIRTSAEAMDIISKVAEENSYAVRKDLDALIEVGEVDNETVFGGYLWEAVEDAVPEMDEETNDLLSDAIIDYWFEQLEGIFDEEEDI